MEEYVCPQEILKGLKILEEMFVGTEHHQLFETFSRNVLVETTLAAEYRTIGYEMAQARVTGEYLEIDIAGIPLAMNSDKKPDLPDSDFPKDMRWHKA